MMERKMILKAAIVVEIEEIYPWNCDMEFDK